MTKNEENAILLKRSTALSLRMYSWEPGQTPSNSVSHQAPNYVQRS